MRPFALGMLFGVFLSIGYRTYFEAMPWQIRESIYSEAIKAGAAVRVVDQETGETSIQWRTCDE